MLAPCEAEDAASLPPNLHFHSSFTRQHSEGYRCFGCADKKHRIHLRDAFNCALCNKFGHKCNKNGEKVLDLHPPRPPLFFFLIGQTVWSHRLWGCGASRCWKETPLGKRNGNNSRKQHTDCIMGHLHKVQSFIVPVSIYDKWMPLMHNVWTAYETFAAENWASCGANPPKTRLEDLEISIQTLGWWNQQFLASALVSPVKRSPACFTTCSL